MYSILKIAKLCLLVIIFCSLSIKASEVKIEKFTLKNGLKVYLVEDNRAPSVALNIFYKVGSIDDPLGFSGVAHMLEHSMFLNLKMPNKQNFDDFAAENGININAYTGNLLTVYTHKFLSEKIEDILKLEAKRMQNLSMTNEEFYREKKVVQEERKLTIDSNPLRIAMEKLIANTYYNNPTKNPVIGWANDIENYHPDIVRKHHEIYYSPNNASIIAVGNINKSKLEKLVKKYFENIKTKQIPERPLALEPNNKGERKIYVKHNNVDQPILLKSYVIFHNKDNYLNDILYCELLGILLEGNDNIRGFLHEDLVERKSVATKLEVFSYLPAYKEPFFIIKATPANEVNLEKLDQEITKSLESYKKLISEEKNLSIFKSIIKNNFKNGRESFVGLSDEISTIISLGFDPVEKINSIYQEIEKLNLEDAKKYLDQTILKDNSVAVFLEKTEGEK